MSLNATAFILCLLTGFMRLVEIALGEINARKMLREGGKEFAPRQRLIIFTVYTLWLFTLIVLAPAGLWPQPYMLGFFVLLEFTRWWAIAHLGKFWTTRIIVVPLAFRITTGPYRFLHHPIYMVLIFEVMALSLSFQQWGAGCFFTGLTAGWVRLRMRAESRALQMML